MNQFQNVGSGVYRGLGFIISREPGSKKFLLMKQEGGLIMKGTLKACQEEAERRYNDRPLAKLARYGKWVTLDQFVGATSR